MDTSYCKACTLPITDGQAYELGADHWHVDCFRCSKCHRQLGVNSNFLVLGTGALVCSECSYICKNCGKKIYDMAILTGDSAYCADCFKCRSCKKPIEDLRYARTSKGLFCMSCHRMLIEKKKRYDQLKRNEISSRSMSPSSSKVETQSARPSLHSKSSTSLHDPTSPVPQSAPPATPKTPISSPTRFNDMSNRSGGYGKSLQPPFEPDGLGIKGLSYNQPLDQPLGQPLGQPLDSPAAPDSSDEFKQRKSPFKFGSTFARPQDSPDGDHSRKSSANLGRSISKVFHRKNNSAEATPTHLRTQSEHSTSAYETPPIPESSQFHGRSISESVYGNETAEAERTLKILRSEIESLTLSKANLIKEIQQLQAQKRTLEEPDDDDPKKSGFMRRLFGQQQIPNSVSSHSISAPINVKQGDLALQSMNASAPLHAPAATLRTTPINTLAIYSTTLQQRADLEGAAVPYIVKACIADLSKRGLYSEGVYRVSGSALAIDKLQKFFDTLDLSSGNVSTRTAVALDTDVNAVAGMLKRYLKKIPEPVIPFDFYNQYVDLGKLPDGTKKSTSLSHILDNLPRTNFETLQLLTAHLQAVANHEKYTKMTLSTLATVFAPTLARDNDGNPQREILDTAPKTAATEYMLRSLVSEHNSPAFL